MEPNFQVPSERPSRVTRDYLLHLIRPAFGLPADLLPAAVDYLEAKGVIANNEVLGYHLPGDQDALLQVPREAERAMHGAILAHCQTPQCPAIVQNVILMPAAGGSGSISQTGPAGTASRTRLAQPPRSDTKRVEAITWHRARHIVELADFGAEAAARVLDHILTRLSAAASGAQQHGAQEAPVISKPAVEPARVTRDDLIARLRPVAPSLGDDLVEPLVNYLVAKGVIIHHGEHGYSLPAAANLSLPRPALDTPALHAAVLGFLKSQDCPSIWKYVVAESIASHEDREADRSPADWFFPPTPDFSKIIDELKKDRVFQLAALQPLEPKAAADLFDHIVASLANPKPPRPRQRSGRATWVPNEQHPWPHTYQVAWAEVLARVEDDRVREEFRQIIEDHRATGHLADSEILDALKSREETDRVAASLSKVLGLPNSSAAEQCRRWTELIEWGQRMYQRGRDTGAQAIDLKDDVFARGLYSDGPLPSPLRWATEAKAATGALHPLAVSAQFAPADMQPLHALGRDLDRILRGEAVDLRAAVEGVRLIVAEIEAQHLTPRVGMNAQNQLGAVVPIAPPTALRQLHEAVKGLAGNLSNLLGLVADYGVVERGRVGEGLLIFDEYRDLQDGVDGPGKPHRDELWRLTARDLKAHHSTAKQLWEQDLTGSGACPKLLFAGVSEATVRCGLLNDSTYHGLLIVLAGIILYPDVPGVVPHYALAEIDSPLPNAGGGVVRLRVVHELYSRPWWRVLELELDKEYARVLGLTHARVGGPPRPLGGDAPTNGTAANEVGRLEDLSIEWEATQEAKRSGPEQVRKREREPSSMQLARWRDILLALPASKHIAMDSPAVLLNKLRERAAEARARERIAVRHDKDSVRRDLAAMRARGWVDPNLLIRTALGDAEAKRPA